MLRKVAPRQRKNQPEQNIQLSLAAFSCRMLSLPRFPKLFSSGHNGESSLNVDSLISLLLTTRFKADQQAERPLHIFKR